MGSNRLPILVYIIVDLAGEQQSEIHQIFRRKIMPDFGNSFSGQANGRKLTHEELVREIRFLVAAEYEAIQLYMQLAESIDNQLAIDVLTDIANEERVHAGEFLRLLYELAPDEKDFYAEGIAEVEEKIEKSKK
jgi:Mn-containing catalase